jgi:hypothetical protein
MYFFFLLNNLCKIQNVSFLISFFFSFLLFFIIIIINNKNTLILSKFNFIYVIKYFYEKDKITLEATRIN